MERQPPAPDAPVFLIGFMATGKTTVGRLLAERLGWVFLDLDVAVCAAAGALSVAQIFAAEGEAGFRRRERAALRAAASSPRTVVATGGGAACDEENLTVMLQAGRVVALAVSPGEAVRRAAGSPGGLASRPLLRGPADPVAAAAALLADRVPFYARAHLRVDTDGRVPAQVAGEILDRLRDAMLGAAG